MNLMKYRKIYVVISVIAIFISLGLWSIKGLNYGIDFTGGTNIRFPLAEKVTSPQVRAVLETPELLKLDLKMTPPQPYNYIDSLGRERYGVQVNTRFLNNEEQGLVVNALESTFGKNENNTGIEVASVDPLIGKELLLNALKAVIIACIFILIYIGFRFEFKSGVAGIIALIHDTLIVFGVFALFQKEIGATFIAAILTIIGYSINDTIVVFDRIRENARFRKKGEPFDELVNLSVLQTLKRSLNTSFTTVIAILVLYLVGSPSIKEFCFALIIGLTAGTYSSVFIASPIWAVWKNAEEKRKAKQQMVTANR